MSSFAEHTTRHFINNSTGILPNLNQNHIRPISNAIFPHSQRLLNHLQNKISQGGSVPSPGGSFPSGGSIWTGGSLEGEADIPQGVASGGSLPFPENEREMYHYMLNLSPQQFEAYRETATQMLGGVPSPMWDKIADGKEPLEADDNEYENIMRMPNQHAAARLLEADSGPTGGGFYKALKHVGRKVTRLYKMGRGALKFVDRNKDILLDLPGVRDYKEGISGFLDTASAIDDVVNPLLDAAIDASGNTATTPESREKLKRMAEKSIDSAIDTYAPQARKYVDVAKDLNNTAKELKRRSYNQ